MDQDPNAVASDKYRKFPVNWLPSEFAIIQRIAKEEYQGIVAQYIRRTVKDDLRKRGLIGPDAQMELFEPVQMEKHKIDGFWAIRPSFQFPTKKKLYVDPPHKFPGFIAGLNRNKGIAHWFREKQRLFLNNS